MSVNKVNKVLVDLIEDYQYGKIIFSHFSDVKRILGDEEKTANQKTQAIVRWCQQETNQGFVSAVSNAIYFAKIK